MARSGRFELPTPRFVVWCSIQLSYERVEVVLENFHPYGKPPLLIINNFLPSNGQLLKRR